jgi:rhomboid protease GluP
VTDEIPGVRFAAAPEELREPALVLAAAGIEHRIARHGDGWRLAVASDDAERAVAALDAYEHERRPRDPEVPFAYRESRAGIVVAALLIGFYVVTGPAVPGSSWAEAGGSSADRVLGGELWRTITALTLHSDPAHVFANAVSIGVFLTPVARLLGPGLGVALVLVAGTVGNLLNALFYRTHHTSIGASTAVFGALGILGGLQFGRRRGLKRAWLAIAGTFALLAMLGAGEHTDVLAHLFGLVSGLVLGIAASYLSRPPASASQRVLGAAALVAMVAAWMVAL